MALTAPCENSRVIALDEYVRHVRTQVDFSNQESILASAPMLRALANNRTLVLDRINDAVEKNFGGTYLRSAQTLELARHGDFIVRAAIWPPAASVATGRVYQEQFSYSLAHDHNFSFMTVNYLGPGYDTDIYEYDYVKVAGYIGESVDLKFLERKRFGAGAVMLYRANTDVHIQHPPAELTITLNLIWATDAIRQQDQFIFDVDRKLIAGYASGDAERRLGLMRMAAQLGNLESRASLEEISQKHPCRRTRLGALESLVQIAPRDDREIWTRALQDPAPLVSREARLRLERTSG